MTKQSKYAVKNLRITFDVRWFRKILILWFKDNARFLPWRKSENWYPVFLSEFLLQQTQVEQVLPYYHKFINTYPTVTDLAKAQEQDILRLWAGLGYYSRARNMLKAAKEIHNKHRGNFPQSFEETLKLPGIGNYTASAILSIAFNKPHAVVDGNVIRVISRLFAIKEDIRGRQTIKRISNICRRLLDENQPGTFNEAMMETGALICKPQNPLCTKCALLQFCRAGGSNSWLKYPFKSTPPPKKERKELAFILLHKSKVLLAQRPASGLLASMWEFPSLDQSVDSNKKDPSLQQIINQETTKQSPGFKHIYTHIRLSYRAIFLRGDFKSIVQSFDWQIKYKQLKSVPVEEISAYPVHNAHRKLNNWFLKIKAE